MGHCNDGGYILNLEPIVEGTKVKSNDAFLCETCIMNKL